MIIKDNFNLAYDLSGNLILTIPKSYIEKENKALLLKSVERLIKSASEKKTKIKDWKNDPALNIVAICQSKNKNGSIKHDTDIYGL